MTALALEWTSFAPWRSMRKTRAERSNAAFTRPDKAEAVRNPELTGSVAPEWVDSARGQLEEIQHLRDGWDGFRAGAIRRDVIHFAETVLNQIMRPLTPAPHIAPMAHSGLMIEWHTYGVDLEIEIEYPGRLWVAFEDSRTKEEDECGLTTDLSKLEGWVGEMSRRHPSAHV